MSSVLALFAMDGFGGNACLHELLHHTIRTMASSGKHERTFHIRLMEQMGEQMLLIDFINHVQALINRINGARYGVNLHRYGMIQNAKG